MWCQEPQTQKVAPLLSIKRFSEAINRFKRCTITGPCTKEEIQEVNAHIELG
jgi:hypothetical protein